MARRPPVPASVFWRRRLLLVAGLIAAVWVATTFIGGEGDKPAPETAAPSASPTPQPTATSGVVPVSLTAGTDPCDPTTVRVTPSVRPGQTAKKTVDVGLVVSTTAEQACTLQPDDAALIAVVTANGTPIWDSTLCPASLLDEPVELSPDWATMVDTSWSGRVSGARCAKTESWAAAGKYALQVGTLGGEPGTTSFTLDAAPKKPKATTTPTPTKTP